MKNPPTKRLGAALFSFVVVVLGPSDARAITYLKAAGSGNWGDAAMWTPVGGPPNSSADRANLQSSGTLTLADSGGNDASFTINILAPTSNVSNTIQNVASGTGRLIFDNGLSNAQLIFQRSASGLINLNVPLQLNSDLEIHTRGGGAVNINGPIVDGVNGSRGITVFGSTPANSNPGSTTTVSGASTYSGSTTVLGNGNAAANGGAKLRIGADNALPTTTVLAVEASSLGGANAQGGRFDLNGFNQTVSGLSGGSGTARGLVTNLTAGASASTLTINNAANFTFSGTIADGVAGTVALTKNGNGVQTLTGANAYTGATTVNAGTLLVGASGSGSLGNTAVTVNAGTVGGTGSLAGVMVVGNGTGGSDAFLSAGDGAGMIGTFTINNALSLGSDATFVFEYNGSAGVPTADQVAANGVTLSGLFSITDISPGTLAPTTQYIVINNTSGSAISGAFSNLADGSTVTSGANQFQVSYSGGTGNDLVLTVVPEPASTALVGLGLALVLSSCRRKN